jgi:hypothetical protein
MCYLFVLHQSCDNELAGKCGVLATNVVRRAANIVILRSGNKLEKFKIAVTKLAE